MGKVTIGRASLHCNQSALMNRLDRCMTCCEWTPRHKRVYNKTTGLFECVSCAQMYSTLEVAHG
jgi:hypothetical protein